MDRVLFSFFYIFVFLTGNAKSLPNDPISALERDTWVFSQHEAEKLNSLEAEKFSIALGSSLKGIANLDSLNFDMEHGRLLEFKVADLNRDGVYEILLRIDVSGRGVCRDVGILSRNSGEYHSQTLPDYGIEIMLLEDESQDLIIGSTNILELSRTDPNVTFPTLYSWEGSQCIDVSTKMMDYYETTYLPGFKRFLDRLSSSDQENMREEARHRLMVETLCWMRVAGKLNNMFPKQLVSEEEIKILNDEVAHFSSFNNRSSLVSEEFKNPSTSRLEVPADTIESEISTPSSQDFTAQKTTAESNSISKDSNGLSIGTPPPTSTIKTSSHWKLILLVLGIGGLAGAAFFMLRSRR